MAVHDFDETTANWTYTPISKDQMLDATTPEATPLTHRGGSLEADPTLDTALNSPGELLDPENIRAGRTAGTNWLNDPDLSSKKVHSHHQSM